MKFFEVMQLSYFSLLSPTSLFRAALGVTVFALVQTVTHASENIAAFYHTSLTNDGRHVGIIDSQFHQLNSSGLLSRLNAVYYGVIHPAHLRHKKKLEILHEKFVNIGYWYGGQEMRTLSKLYDFCKSNPSYKVLYFHMKGGSNPLLRNQQAREVLGAFTLNPSCIDALDSFQTCGWRLSPVPYIHYSGNFWWARCEYISGLVDPKTMMIESPRQQEMSAQMLHHFSSVDTDTAKYAHKAMVRMEICVGLGRFFGEAWIGSAASLLAADCLPNHTDPNFIMYGEYVPPFLNLAREYMSKKRTMVCGPAEANVSVDRFLQPFHEALKSHPCAVVTTGIRRGFLFYNQTSHSLIQWRKRFGEDMSQVPKVLAEYGVTYSPP